MRLFLVAACVVGAVVTLAAQDGVFDSLSVESTSSDALDVAGGLELGVDLSAENGGVPETAVISDQRHGVPGAARGVPDDDSGPREPHRVPVCSCRRVTARRGSTWLSEVAMRDIIKGACIGGLVAAFASVLLAQSWTAPITWTTGDLLTAAQFNAQFRDNLLNLRATAACADGGITGMASADTVLFGDCRWDSVPTTTVVALDVGSTATTASTYQTVGPTGTLTTFTGQTVTTYFSGTFSRLSTGAICELRVQNTTTATTLVDGISSLTTGQILLAQDTPPAAANAYAVQIRRTNSVGMCTWRSGSDATSRRGFIAVVT